MTVCEDGSFLSQNGYRYSALILPPMEYTPAMANLLSDLAAVGNVIRVGDDATAIADLPDLLTRRALTVKEPTHGILRLVRDTENGRACLLVNTGETESTAAYTIEGMEDPVLYDPFHDTEIPCDFVPDGDSFAFTVTLPAMRAYIIKEA